VKNPRLLPNGKEKKRTRLLRKERGRTPPFLEFSRAGEEKGRRRRHWLPRREKGKSFLFFLLRSPLFRKEEKETPKGKKLLWTSSTNPRKRRTPSLQRRERMEPRALRPMLARGKKKSPPGPRIKLGGGRGKKLRPLPNCEQILDAGEKKRKGSRLHRPEEEKRGE